MRFPERAGAASPAYYFECLAFTVPEKAMQAYLAEFLPRSAPSEEHVHEGSEFLYVLSGTLAVHIHGEEHHLSPGDSLFFDASEAHAYRGLEGQAASAVVVTMPLRL
jgi:quercetin dioxygenase-like cupin family protein